MEKRSKIDEILGELTPTQCLLLVVLAAGGLLLALLVILIIAT